MLSHFRGECLNWFGSEESEQGVPPGAPLLFRHTAVD
jgi:hypothetical protein